MRAESEASRDDWVKLLLRAVFTSQNEGESVKVCFIIRLCKLEMLTAATDNI